MIRPWTSLRGNLLIAAPGLIDPNFWRTVVLVGEHSDEGALGVVLNRTSDTSVDEAVPELAVLVDGMGEVHVGGPVQPSAVVVLADFAEPPDRARSCWSPSASSRPRSSPNRSGSCGELASTSATPAGARASWTTSSTRARGSSSPRSRRTSSPTSPDGLWSTVLQRKGGPFRVLAAMPPDPSLN